MEDFQSKYSGEQVEGMLDQIANGEISGGSSVYKWNWNSEMNGTFTEEEFENLSNADVVYITTGVADMEMLYSVDGRAVVEDALHLGVHILSFETDTDNSKAAYVESITFIFDNSSKTWSAQGGDAELITNEQLTSALEDKQDKITDLDTIRSGAEKGATALQSVPSEYVTESELTNKGYATTSALNNKVDKVSGKQLSTEDFTTALKSKLEGLNNYDDTELSNALSILRGDFDKLVSGDTTTAIKTFNEVIAFLDGVQDSQNLSSIIASIEQQIAGKMDKVTLATVATSGSYNDLSNKPTIPTTVSQLDNDVEYITHEDVAAVARTGSYNDLEDKPTIPSAVTESTVSGWGFTKNTGTYSKPSSGIPKTDLASAVQTSLGKADSALQSYTEKYTGTITGIKMNGASKGTSGVVDLGTVITSHQDISGKADKSSLSAVATSGSYNDLTDQPDFIKGVAINGTVIADTSGTVYIPNASNGGYGVTKLNNSISSTSTTESATPSAVKAAYDLANSKQDTLISGTNIKTINGQSIVGSGNLIIEGGSVGNYVEKERLGDTEVAYIQGFNTGNNVYGLPDTVANGDADDYLVARNTLKTINGEYIWGSGDIEISGGGGGDSSVFITHFTVDEFVSGYVEFTDEQVEAIIDAARQNKIIALPQSRHDGHTGFLVSSYEYSYNTESEIDRWSLYLNIIHNSVSYSNTTDSALPQFRPALLIVTPFRPLIEGVSVDDEGYALADSFNKDNLIIVVGGECTYLQIGEVGIEYGMTVRFFTGEDCTIEYWGNWANGVIPTIEPYTAYEMSIVYGADYTPCAVLTPFKPVE